MVESNAKLPKKERNLLGVFLKLVFFVCALFAVMVTVLFNMGGSSETLHASLEKLISDSLNGRPTRVLKLNRVTFFPSVGADFEKLQVKETMASEELTVSAEKVRFFVTFWGFITRTMGIKALYLEDIKIKKGILGRNALTIEKMFIDHDKGTQKAVARANGLLENEPWTFAMDMDVSGSVGGYTYHIGRNRSLSLDVGDFRIKGSLNEHIGDYLKVDDFSVGMPEDILKGELSISLLEGQIVKIGGRLADSSTASVFAPDLLINYAGKTPSIEGKIESLQLDPGFSLGQGGPIALFNALHEKFSFDPFVQELGKDKEPPADEKNKDEKTAKAAEDKKDKPKKTETAFACRYDFNIKFTVAKTLDSNGKEEGEGAEFDAVNKDGMLKIIPHKGSVESFEGPCREYASLSVKKKSNG